MFDKSDLSFLVNLDRLNDIEKNCYGLVEKNPVIAWLEENVGPATIPQLWPYTGEHWKCWVVFDPHNHFELSYCEVNFTSDVDDSILSLFILRWT